jgi:hypothetical protein
VVEVQSDAAEEPDHSHNLGLAGGWMAVMPGIRPECTHFQLLLLVCKLIARKPALETIAG